MARILVIDDDTRTVAALSDILQLEGHEVISAHNGKEGLALYQRHHPDLVITDILMPERDGLETILDLAEADVRIIAMSGGEGLLDFLADGVAFGACRSLRKPFGHRQLLSAVDDALTIKRGG